MEFRLDRDLPIPVGVQLRGQIEYGIGFGELQPGERLPSVREMADLLGVAPMTVAEAYRELKANGLIHGRIGSGTFVSDTGKPLNRAGRDMIDLHRRIDQLIGDGLALGLRPSDLTSLIGARMAVRQSDDHPKRLVLIGNFAGATQAYAAVVAEVLGPLATLEAITLDAVKSDPAIRRQAATADLVLTFAHRRHEVLDLLPGSLVVAISFIPSEATRRSLASLDPLMHVLVVSIFPEFTTLMKTAVHRFAPHVPNITVTLPGAPDFEALLRRADVLVYATGADDLVARLPAGTSAFEYRHTPDAADIRRVVLPLIASLKPTDKLLEEAS
jgi:DNA-binding transcriptional regulator YhcF (GntR family)